MTTRRISEFKVGDFLWDFDGACLILAISISYPKRKSTTARCFTVLSIDNHIRKIALNDSSAMLFYEDQLNSKQS